MSEYKITVVQPDRCTGHKVVEFEAKGEDQARSLVRVLAENSAFNMKVEILHEGVLVPMPVQELFAE